MLIVVTGSGNSSVFKRVTRASQCRCSRQVLVCRYVHKAMHNFEEHISWFFLTPGFPIPDGPT